MKKEYIIGGCIGIVFVIAIIVCIFVSKKIDKKAPYIPTIAKVVRLDENGKIVEDENKVKIEGEDKKKLDEYVSQIKDETQKATYSLIFFVEYNVRVDEHISLKVKSDIKEYVYYVDDTKPENEREIVTRAPEGFVDWVVSHASK